MVWNIEKSNILESPTYAIDFCASLLVYFLANRIERFLYKVIYPLFLEVPY